MNEQELTDKYVTFYIRYYSDRFSDQSFIDRLTKWNTDLLYKNIADKGYKPISDVEQVGTNPDEIILQVKAERI